MSLKAGDIIENYPYLWLRQYKAGETEGRKPRPVCVAVAVADEAGSVHLALLPISSQHPTAKQVALEVPQTECRRLRLEEDKRAWIYVSEYNYDLLGESYYLPSRPKAKRSLSGPFLKLVLIAFKDTLKQKTGRVSRK